VLEELYGIVPGSKHQVWSSLGSEEVTPLLRPLALRVRVVGLPGAHGMPHRRDARAPRDAIPGRVWVRHGACDDDDDDDNQDDDNQVIIIITRFSKKKRSLKSSSDMAARQTPETWPTASLASTSFAVC
jgi:hypothetical protein